MGKSQGEAVFQAVCEVIGGDPDGKVILRKDELAAVHSKVLLAFTSGQTVHSKSPNEATLLKYIPGLVNNWLRKDKRLNGGVQYAAKNPGSRTRSGDESVRAMRTLLSVTTDVEAKQQIQLAIDERLALIKPKTTAVIDPSKLPEALRRFVPQ
jgi:hypothetical protein